MEEQLERKRAGLYKEFIAMEEAPGKLQSQQIYLSAAIASMARLSAGSQAAIAPCLEYKRIRRSGM